MPKVKSKERISKAATERWIVTYRGISVKLSDDFPKETLKARRDWQEILKATKPTAKIVLPSKDIIWNQRAGKEFSRKEKNLRGS